MAAKEKEKRPPGGPPRRRIRNFLLDTRFQLKYTGMVVAVTVVVATALGMTAYSYSQGMTEMLAADRMVRAAEMDEETALTIQQEAQAEDQKILFSIIGGVFFLAFVLGLTGIVVTHKVVGPAYKLRLLLGRVAEGSLNVKGGFRKGDELQDVGEAFTDMVTALREQREEHVRSLEEIIKEAKAGDVDASLVTKLNELRDRMQTALDA